jgi:ribonuclease Z
MSDKSFIAQKFAKLNFGQHTVLGYSVAGEETVVQIPELNVCFDIGRCPLFALTSDIVCIGHSHMDHIAGLPYYFSQRHFQGLKTGTVLLPSELVGPVERLMRVWRDVEHQDTPYNLIGMTPGQVHSVRKDFAIRAFKTHHGRWQTLGYSLVSLRKKLKAEYVGKDGKELAALAKSGVELSNETEVPLIAYTGDTAIGPVFDNADVQNAEILITECTFYEKDHKETAKAGKHIHVDHFAEILPKLKNKHIVLGHLTRRTGIKQARYILEKTIGIAKMENIHFLMDFYGADDAGEMEGVGAAE